MEKKVLTKLSDSEDTSTHTQDSEDSSTLTEGAVTRAPPVASDSRSLEELFAGKDRSRQMEERPEVLKSAREVVPKSVGFSVAR